MPWSVEVCGLLLSVDFICVLCDESVGRGAGPGLAGCWAGGVKVASSWVGR